METLFRSGFVLGSLFLSLQSVSAQTWTQTSAPITNWCAIASSADGSRLVAVANGEPFTGPVPGPIYLSTNSGGTWTLASNAPAAVWCSVASSADGTQLAAAIAGGLIYRSTDSGLTWTPTGAPKIRWVSVTSSSDGNKLSALARVSPPSPPPDFYTSGDAGNTWNTNALPYDRWTTLSSSADGMILVAGGATGTLLTSTNQGSSWTTNIMSNTSFSSVASSADGRRLLAAANTLYLSTNDGLVWIQINAPAVNQVASSADGRTLVAAAYVGPIYVSIDFGASWITNVPPGTNYWKAIACSADGSKLAAAVNNVGGGGGGIWTAQTTPKPQMNIVPTNGNFALSWIIPSTNFVLQQNLDLNTSNWLDVTNPPVLNLANLQEEVTLPVTNGCAFYRLARQ